MKRVVLSVVIFLSVLAVLINGAAIFAGAEKVFSKANLVVHVAALYTKSPDQKLEMPVQGLTKNQVVDSWHVPRDSDRVHEGQDIFAKRGTPVISATDGYVVRIAENSLGGQTVFVLGAGARTYYYAHLDSYAANLAVGDHVTTQTILGYVGNSGNAAGSPPHLHFGVYERGQAINPLPLLENRIEDKPSKTK
jgi:peptidoglycan LD-endopeptidase LytH